MGIDVSNLIRYFTAFLDLSQTESAIGHLELDSDEKFRLFVFTSWQHVFAWAISELESVASAEIFLELDMLAVDPSSAVRSVWLSDRLPTHRIVHLDQHKLESTVIGFSPRKGNDGRTLIYCRKEDGSSHQVDPTGEQFLLIKIEAKE